MQGFLAVYLAHTGHTEEGAEVNYRVIEGMMLRVPGKMAWKQAVVGGCRHQRMVRMAAARGLEGVAARIGMWVDIDGIGTRLLLVTKTSIVAMKC